MLYLAVTFPFHLKKNSKMIKSDRSFTKAMYRSISKSQTYTGQPSVVWTANNVSIAVGTVS